MAKKEKEEEGSLPKWQEWLDPKLDNSLKNIALFFLEKSRYLVIVIVGNLLLAWLAVVLYFCLNSVCFGNIGYSAFAVLHILMGDEYGDYFTLPIPWWVISLLVPLRMFGWLILPIIVSVVLETGINAKQLRDAIASIARNYPHDRLAQEAKETDQKFPTRSNAQKQDKLDTDSAANDVTPI